MRPWTIKHTPWGEEPDPNYDAEADYDRWAEAAEMKAEQRRERE